MEVPIGLFIGLLIACGLITLDLMGKGVYENLKSAWYHIRKK